jgi:hypothetical protein
VVLALDFEGPGFVDRSSSPRTIVVSGDAQISGTDPKFGAGCGLFGGSNDFLQVTDIGNFAAGDFTVQAWVFLNSAATGSRIIVDTRTSNTSSGFGLYVRSDNKLTFVLTTENVLSIQLALNTNPRTTFPRDQWVHVEFVKKFYPANTTTPKGLFTYDINLVWVFANGVELFADEGDEGPLSPLPLVFPVGSYNLNSTSLSIGARWGGGANFWSGRLDDLRITKKALHTSSFVPPTAALPNY